MKRDRFDRESEILQQDFGEVLQLYGGKTAGLMLQQAVIARAPQLGTIIGTPPYSGITTELYNAFEEVVDSKGGLALVGEDDAVLEPEHYEQDVLVPSLRKQVEDEVDGLLRNFQRQGVEVNRETLFHVRVSAVNEDFADDAYWNVFGTHAGIPLFRGFRLDRKEVSFAVRAIISLLAEFYLLKQLPAYCLPKDLSCGITVQLTANSIRHCGYGITAYSSYPEPEFNDEPVWELYQMSRAAQFKNELGWSGPHMFGCFVHYQLVLGGARMVPGYYLEPLKMHPEEVRRHWYWEGMKALKEGFLTKRQSRLLSEALKGFAGALGYPVNMELWTITPRDEFFRGVQLRPVPVLDPNRPVRKLEPLGPDRVLLAETPFAHGSFKLTAQLVMPEDRWKYVKNHRFEEPVILCYDRGRDLMDFAKMLNVAVALNLKEGRALQHSFEFRPHFPFREHFCYLGLPMLHWLVECFGPIQEYESPLGGTYRLRYTPFSVTVEADGRFGRISMLRADAERFGVKPLAA